MRASLCLPLAALAAFCLVPLSVSADPPATIRSVRVQPVNAQAAPVAEAPPLLPPTEVQAQPAPVEPARAETREGYFMVVFSYQQPGRMVYSQTHTFATFVKTTSTGSIAEQHTISWLPATANVRVLALRPETGRNFGLQESIELGRANGARVSQWGPYEIRQDLFGRAKERVAQLDAGQQDYVALDNRWRDRGVATNCIHAVSDIAGRLDTGRAAGDAATAMVVEHLSEFIIDRSSSMTWLERELGLPEQQVTKVARR